MTKEYDLRKRKDLDKILRRNKPKMVSKLNKNNHKLLIIHSAKNGYHRL